jgi:hypothetical protein
VLWLLTSLFFLWCAYREIRGSMVAAPGYDVPSPVSASYLAAVLTLAVLFAWPPVHIWYFEWFLSRKATELADGHRARVHCNTVFDTMLDPMMLAAGHADLRTGKIGLQQPWCGILMSYLAHPERATEQELDSLDLITHESMHVRGERDEARTECEAVQRNYRAARLLGVPARTARKNALEYYYFNYQERGKIGGMQGEYYSDQCAPGKTLDEHLSDSSWANP